MGDATRIIRAICDGESNSSEALLPLVYEELRTLARKRIAAERPGHTLQATALVNEAYVRLVDVEHAQQWDGKRHFFAAAAEAMRRILVEHARKKKTQKRGGERQRQEYVESTITTPWSNQPDRVLAVHSALDEFARVDGRAAELVKLRFFAGMTIAEAAEILSVSSRTANKWWNYAKAWLTERMGDLEGD